MAHRILINGRHALICPDGVPILSVGREAGFGFPHACRNGVCGLCKCRLLAGEITYHWKQPYGLWEKHIAEGLILPCIAFATSDLTLDRIPLVDTDSGRS